jgi:hypothetical protein
MENKNCTIPFHVFVGETKYPIHIVIYVMVLGGDKWEVLKQEGLASLKELQQ